MYHLIQTLYNYPVLHSQDVNWFIRAYEQLLREHMVITSVPKEPYFVDFLRDAPEATGEEDDDSNLDAPKIFEMVRGYKIATM